MKQLIAICSIVLVTGCATQPSTYVDRSTPDKRDIEATGRAAVEAAKSNTSNNVDVEGVQVGHTHTPGVWDGKTVDSRGMPIVFDQFGNKDIRASLRAIYERDDHNYQRGGYIRWATEDFKRQADYKIKRNIRKRITKITDKIF